MTLLFFVVWAIFAAIVGALLWWYIPDIRKPWAPLLKLRKGFLKKYKKLILADIWIEIRKSERRLLLYEADRLIKEFPCALGTDPVHNKKRAGDGCTPEGEYYICTKNDKSRYHLFLGLSYPNEKDAERGRKKGLIDQKEYHDIINAVTAKKRPPWDTKLGGQIGIHGGGLGIDWTEGGIAVKNADIEELFMLTEIGQRVKIIP